VNNSASGTKLEDDLRVCFENGLNAVGEWNAGISAADFFCILCFGDVARDPLQRFSDAPVGVERLEIDRAVARKPSS
jgi:hypothetical protein